MKHACNAAMPVACTVHVYLNISLTYNFVTPWYILARKFRLEGTSTVG